MENKMTWEQRWNMHNDLRKEHAGKAQAALRAAESRKQKDWEEYKRESKLSNKHFGIAQAMFTRKHGKI